MLACALLFRRSSLAPVPEAEVAATLKYVPTKERFARALEECDMAQASLTAAGTLSGGGLSGAQYKTALPAQATCSKTRPGVL
jgi:hypothetical protein